MAEKTLRERYRELKEEGFTDDQLVKKLKEQGFSSKDYDLPLNEAKARAKLRLEGKLPEGQPPPASSTTSGKPPTSPATTQPPPSPTPQSKGVFEGLSPMEKGEGPVSQTPASNLSPSAQRVVEQYNLNVLPKVKALPEKQRLAEEQRVRAEAEQRSQQRPAEVAKLNQELAQAKGKKREEGKVVIPFLQEAVEMFIPQEAYEYLPEAVVPTKGKPEPKYAPTLEIGPSMERFVKVGKGIAKEFMDEVADVAGGVTALASDLTGGGVLPLQPTRKSKATELIEQTAEELKRKEKEQAGKGGLTRLGEFAVAVPTGAKDVVLGIADILNYLGGVNVRQGETRSQEAERRGAEVLAGMTGVSANSIRNLTNFTFWETKPVEAILGFMPIYDLVLGGTLRVPGGAELVNKAGGVIAKTTESIKRSKPVTEVRRKASEGFATREAGTSAVSEQVFRTPEAEASAVKAAGTKAAEQVKKPTPPREGQNVFGERVIEKEGGQPVVETITEKPLTAVDYVNRNYLSPGPEEVIQLSSKEFPVESGGVVAKRKYFTGDLRTTAPTELMEEGGFSLGELDLTQEPARKAKALVDQNVSLETKVGTLSSEISGLLEDLTGKGEIGDWLNDTINVYRRLLVENVDNPKAVLQAGVVRALRTQLDTLEVKKYLLDNNVKRVIGKVNDLTNAVTDFIIADTEINNNKARVQALLTDSVIPPARTTDLYSIERGTGKLVKGTKVSESVVLDLKEKLDKLSPEERAKYILGEGEPLSPRQTAELSEFL